jgi:PAS domain S-box-containing protein
MVVARQCRAFSAPGARNFVPAPDSASDSLDSLQRQLEESQERFRTLTENAFDLICEVDERGVYRYVSPNHRDLLGWDVGAMVGQSVLDQIHPGQRTLIEQRLQQAALEGSGEVDVQVRTADGEWRWFESRGRSYRTADGELRFVVISRDVTARREVEERLRREREFQRRLVALQDADRRLMAFEIHDGLVQDLYGAQLFLESIQHFLPPAADEGTAFLSAVQLLRGAIEEARRIINGLRPPILDDQGLIAALDHLAEDMGQTWGVQIDFQADVQFEHISATVENAVYRIVQECLNNVRKHAGVDRASVRLLQDEGELEIEVADQGKGFDPEAVSEKNYGLVGIADRTRILGGDWRFESEPGAGTRVWVRLPLSAGEEFDMDPGSPDMTNSSHD